MDRPITPSLPRTSTDLSPNRAATAQRAPRWVPETRFGHWFLGTNVWQRYVVKVAIDRLARLVPAEKRSGGCILDAGSGPGVSLPLLDEAFSPREIIAIDADPAEVQRSTRQARRCRCPVDVRRGDAAATGLPDASIDLVLCHQLLHHVVQQEQVLEEFYRILRPGGTLLVAESCRSFILSTPVQLLFRHPNHVQKNADQYQALIREAGFSFRPEHVEVSTPFWSKIDWGLLERIGIRWFVPAEETEILLAATRP